MTAIVAQGCFDPKIKTASFSDLRTLWEKKEYRILPKPVFRYLRRESGLSDGSILCWQTLFEMAYFEDYWAVTTSKSILANELGKSQSTISRLLNELETAGYIIRRHKKLNNVWQMSEIQITLPQIALLSIQEAPDRAKSKEPVSSENVPRRTFTSSTKPKSEEIHSSNKHNALNRSETLPKKSSSQGLSATSTSGSYNHKHHTEGYPDLNKGLSDFEITNNIININTKYNKPTNQTKKPTAVVVLDNENEKTASALQEKLKRLKHREEIILRQPSTSPKAHCKIIREISMIETALERLAFLQNKQLEQKKMKSKLELLESDPTRVLQQPGKRSVSAFQLRRIQTALGQYFPTPDQKGQKNRLINEIIHEIRFGSLVNSQNGTVPLAVNHAINIAIKLVREGRWCQPTKMGVENR